MGLKPTPEQERIFKFIKKRPENILIEAYAGAGKCLGFNTPILMYDGTIKKIQDVKLGDLLMGDDSMPRKVLNTNIGNGKLYRIIPNKGESWICNDVHILTHHHERKKGLIDLPLNEINYPKYSNGNYRYARLQRTGVMFPEKETIIDPYLLGLWLGDGTKFNGSPQLSVSIKEKPILNYLKNVEYFNITPKFNEYQKNLITVSLTTPNFNGRKINNIVRDEFKKCLNDKNNLIIPDDYKINSRTNRLKLFAGIIDSDGYQNHKYYEIITKYESFADDIVFLARSLGFSGYKKKRIKTIKSLNFSNEYWSVSISGSFEEVPVLLKRKKCEPRKQNKSVLRTGFKTEYIGIGDYYGFTLDGNGRFLLGDFTITHNTTTIVEAVTLIPKDKNVMFMAFNKHIQEELKTRLPEHVRCYTSHGLGMSAIKRKYGDKIKFDEFKADKHIQKKAKRWDLDHEFSSNEEKYRYLRDIKKMVNLCRLSLTTDKKYIPFIADRYEVALTKDEDIKRILKVLDSMTQDRKTFDFTDMVYLPAVDNSLWLFPQDYVIIDECLPHKTYISTEIGKKQIGTLYNLKKYNKSLPKIISFNETSKLFEMKNIIDVWCTGEKDVHYVILSGKRKLKSTVNHKFLTLNGWKRLDELKIGDAVLSNYSEQPYHGILNSLQKDIFIGSILGDGSHHRLSNNISRIRIIHGNNQWKYINWKARFFDCDLKTIEKNGYSKKLAHTISTKGYYFHNKYDSKKRIIDDITLRSLAISWMDDGSISKLYNTSRLYSTSYSEELTLYLGNVLKNKWNIDSQIKYGPSSSTNKLNYWLLFNKENTTKISKLISPYVHKSMEYKLCSEHRDNIDYSNWNNNLKSFGCMVVTKTHKFAKKEKVYDMTVEDNHNFIITSQTMNNSNAKNYGLIAHNCQDINRAQQRLIEKMLRRDKHTKKYKGRLIAIGDGFQSIYGFTGITDRTYQWFKEFQDTKILPLSHSFRCSKKVIEHAQKIVPNIKALPDAPEGDVRNGDVLSEAESGDFILCRTTMPLIKLFFDFLSQQKKAVIKGSDIGIQITDLINDFKTIPELISYWTNEIEKFKKDLYKSGILNPQEHSGFVALEDKVNTLLFLADVSTSIDGLKNNIKTIFTDNLTGIVLSTIHKAKGLEANRVFIIRPDLIPLPNSRKWQYIQEKNLEYVAITRAKTDLIYDHDWTDEE